MNLQQIVRALLPLLLLGAGGLAAFQIARQPTRAARTPPPPEVPVVEILTLHAASRTARISGSGLVAPARELNLTPQVSGPVTYVSPRLVPGARVAEGEVLVRIDAREYELAIEQQRGSVRGAELQIEEERARQALAQHEWQALGESGEPPPLVSRQSQLAAAQATLASGVSALERARLALSRATLRAPFDAAVIRESVELGQAVSPGSALAYLVGTREIRVEVSVRLDELRLLSIPGMGSSSSPGSAATVTQRLGHGANIVRRGRVARLVEQLDERTRRARVVVTIEDALSTREGLPLLPGAMVVVELEGRDFDGVFSVPRHAVYDGDKVWVSEQGRLAQRTLQVAWADQVNLYVTGGVAEGDQLVVSRLDRPLAGSQVRRLEEARAEAGGSPGATEPKRSVE